jgi:hypothetical protein
MIPSGFDRVVYYYLKNPPSFDRIESLDHDYQNVSKGSTTTKQTLKSTVVTFTDAYCGTLHNLGMDSANQQLAAITATNFSSLSSMRDSNLLAKAKDVAEILVTNQENLADYGITTDFSRLGRPNLNFNSRGAA